MTGVPTQEEFEEAAHAAPPSPLDLEQGDKIIVGRGDGSPPSAGKLQQQRGVVTKVVQRTKLIDICFNATSEKGACKLTFHASELVAIGYACPEVSRRVGGFCTEKLNLKSAKGSKSIETPRSPFEHYRNLVDAGFNFNTYGDVEEISVTDLAILLRAPRPDSIQDGSSGDGYRTLSHYIMDRAGNESATDDKNVVLLFRVFIVRHLQVIHHHLQGNRGPLGLAWFGGSSASGTTSDSAFGNNAHVFNVTQERVEKSLKLSSEGYSMSQKAANLYDEAGAQHMSVTLLPFDPKAQVVATRGIVQQLGSLSEVTELSGASNLSNLPSLLDFLKSVCDNQRSSHPTDRPPPPPPGAPPPRDSGPMPQDQWLRAIKTIDGVQYPYWYNPARLDAQGRPICSWTCPALADEPATNSAGQSHRSASSGRELEPNLSNIAVTEVPVANCVNAGKALTLASTELERVFYEVFPGSEKTTRELKPGLLGMIKFSKGGSRYRLTQTQAKSFDILDRLSLQNVFSVVPIGSAAKQSTLAALFSCEKKVAEGRLDEAMVSTSSFYEALSRGDGRAKSISCFVYDSGAYGLLPSRGDRGTQAQSTAVSLRKPRGSIFGTCFCRGDKTNEDYVKASAASAASAAPTTLRLVLSGGAASSALFFPPWSTLNQDQRGVFQDDKATACRMDAGSVVDSSIIFPLNRTYSVFSGEIVFIFWDLVSTPDSAIGTMLPDDIFSENQPFERVLREKIIKPSILHVVGGGSAFFRCGSVVSLVAVTTSVVTYGDWGDVTDTLRYGEVVERMQQGGLFDEDAQSSARLFVEGCLCDEMRPSCIPSEFQRQGSTLQLNFSPGIYTDILCGFISSTARTVSNELISQLFGVGKVSADDLMEIARNRGLVPDEMLMACTLTASCAGDGLDSGLRKEVVLNLSRVEVKSTSTCDEPGESFLFVLHWEKRAKRLRTGA